MWKSHNPEYFAKILYTEKKKDLVRLCRDITLHGDDLANLVLSSSVSVLLFHHDSHHREVIPDDIQLRPMDLETMGKARSVPWRNPWPKPLAESTRSSRSVDC